MCSGLDALISHCEIRASKPEHVVCNLPPAPPAFGVPLINGFIMEQTERPHQSHKKLLKWFSVRKNCLFP